MLNNILLSILQVSVYKTTIWSSMFQKKIDELFHDIPNIFGIAADILIAGYDTDGRDHDERLGKVLCTCKQVNLKLNKEKGLFTQTCILFW